MTKDIVVGLAAINERIRLACQKADRRQDDVHLLLATKTVTADTIRVAIESGETMIGENKVQELKQKNNALSDLKIEKHFIGHLRTNKIKEILKYVSCIQSVDSLALAEKLDQRLQLEAKQIDIFIQVNTPFEQSKFGVHPTEALNLIKAVNRVDTMKIKGLTDASIRRLLYTLLK